MQFRTPDQMPAKSGGKFLKLKDNESVTGVFRGDVLERFSIWDGKSYIPAQEGEPKAGLRFTINFVTHENGEFVAKLWEGGRNVYETLAELDREYGLSDTKVKITRKGSGTDTEYSILPTKDQLVDAHKKQIAAVVLQPLEGDVPARLAPSSSVADEIPF